jgi:hypothetical protein
MEIKMRRIAIAFASAGLLALGIPAATSDTAQAQQRVQLAQADVKVKVRTGDRERRKVVIRGDRGRHVGFSHSRHYGYGRNVTVVKKKPGRTVIKKFEG